MSLLNRLAEYQKARFLWLLMIAVTVGLTCVAHYFFQDYLYMQPCEQCVYIRFAMFTMAFGGLFAVIYPNDITRAIAYTLAFYGCLIGIDFCITLNEIHHAVHSENAFGGVVGCREIPVYPFALPLHEMSPSWFLPTGDCGLDNPFIPDDAKLSAIQEFFVGTAANDFEDGLYSNGWYLIPSIEFMNMAIACLLCFGMCLIALIAMFAGYAYSLGAKAKIYASTIVIVSIALVVIGNLIKSSAIASMGI